MLENEFDILSKLVRVEKIAEQKRSSIGLITLEESGLSRGDKTSIKSLRNGVYLNGKDRIVIHNDCCITINNRILIDIGICNISYHKL